MTRLPLLLLLALPLSGCASIRPDHNKGKTCGDVNPRCQAFCKSSIVECTVNEESKPR